MFDIIKYKKMMVKFTTLNSWEEIQGDTPLEVMRFISKHLNIKRV